MKAEQAPYGLGRFNLYWELVQAVDSIVAKSHFTLVRFNKGKIYRHGTGRNTKAEADD